MEAILMTIYVLMWPVIVGGILWTVCKGFLVDMFRAKKDGRSII